jgi:hypothetical protein
VATQADEDDASPDEDVAAADVVDVDAEPVGEPHVIDTAPRRPRIGSFELCGEWCDDSTEMKKSMPDDLD